MNFCIRAPKFTSSLTSKSTMSCFGSYLHYFYHNSLTYCASYVIFWRVLFLVLLLPSSYDFFTRTYAFGSYNLSTRTYIIGHILLPRFVMSSPCFPTSFKKYCRSPPYWSSTVLFFICLCYLNWFSITLSLSCTTPTTPLVRLIVYFVR